MPSHSTQSGLTGAVCVGHTSVSLIQEGLKESLTLGMDGEQQEKVRGLRRKPKNKVNVTFQSAV